MFYYFGGKKRIAHLYPAPRFETVIEPFAGAAGYSMQHWRRSVWINELDARIYRLWLWLQQARPRDILLMPRPPSGTLIDARLGLGLGEEQLTLLKLYCEAGTFLRREHHRIKSSRYSRSHNLHKLAREIPKIRHWRITNLHYRDLENQEATWFIDPPYQAANLGDNYVNRHIDYNELAEWSRSRKGQVIVCEASGATWLPFRRFWFAQGNTGAIRRMEMIWTSD